MRNFVLVIAALSVLLVAGCGSGNRPSSSPSIALIPEPAFYSGTYQFSSFANTAVAGYSGTLYIDPDVNGNITGQITDTSTSVSAPVTGTLLPNGTANIIITGTSYTDTLTGTLVYTATTSTTGTITGTLNVDEEDVTDGIKPHGGIAGGTITVNLATANPV